LEERPGLSPFAQRENLPEQKFGFSAIEEMLLVGRVFIGVRNKAVYIALGIQADGAKDYLGPWDRKHRKRQILAAGDEGRQRGSTPQPAPARVGSDRRAFDRSWPSPVRLALSHGLRITGHRETFWYLSNGVSKEFFRNFARNLRAGSRSGLGTHHRACA